MSVETKLWDPVERLNTPQAIATCLEAVLEHGDARLVAAALGDIARARGLDEVARPAGLSRDRLAKSLTQEGELPLSLARALGLKIRIAA
jgi:probable addiction module antidote protein